MEPRFDHPIQPSEKNKKHTDTWQQKWFFNILNVRIPIFILNNASKPTWFFFFNQLKKSVNWWMKYPNKFLISTQSPRLWFSCTPLFRLYHRDLRFTLSTRCALKRVQRLATDLTLTCLSVSASITKPGKATIKVLILNLYLLSIFSFFFRICLTIYKILLNCLFRIFCHFCFVFHNLFFHWATHMSSPRLVFGNW